MKWTNRPSPDGPHSRGFQSEAGTRPLIRECDARHPTGCLRSHQTLQEASLATLHPAVHAVQTLYVLNSGAIRSSFLSLRRMALAQSSMGATWLLPRGIEHA